MRLPKMNELSKTRIMTDTFGGYNHNLKIGDGEFFDMENMTSDYFPILSPRGKRGVYNAADKPLGMIAKDALCYVDGSKLFINEHEVTGLSLNPNTEKTLVSMGAYVIIMPDKKYVNTANTSDHGDIEASFSSTTTPTGYVHFSLCDATGTDYANGTTTIPASTTPPEEPVDGQYWIDTSSAPHTLKIYSSANEQWTGVGTTYIKVYSLGIGEHFKQYDGVNISGVKGKTQNKDLDAIDGSFVLWEVSKDYIVITGMLDASTVFTDIMTVKLQMPDVDFLIESENRLWGCKYGIGQDGKPVNEIYASKLGDFRNWYCFMGISTDSYAVSLGSDGAFTGAYTYLGHPLFFKENCVHKIFGNYPSNYQVQTTACRGVEKGSSNSLAMVNETLYYKGKNGICAYDGSLPVEISNQLGEVKYANAVAASHGNKYYISMLNVATDKHELFVYDVLRGLWHREDNTNVKQFCSCRNELYYIESGKTCIRTMLGSGEKVREKLRWKAVTGLISTDNPDRKYVSNIQVRMSMELGAKVSFYVKYDSMGDWEFVCTHTATNLRGFTMPIKPRRCDHLQIKIEGIGDAKIYSITKSIEQGSDK